MDVSIVTYSQIDSGEIRTKDNWSFDANVNTLETPGNISLEKYAKAVLKPYHEAIISDWNMSSIGSGDNGKIFHFQSFPIDERSLRE